MLPQTPLTLTVMLFVSFLSACKIVISTPEGGHVRSSSGAYDCPGKKVCSVPVYDIHFDETFTAIPEEGYFFAGWRNAEKTFCARSIEPCTLKTSGLSGQENLLQILESDEEFFLYPDFRVGGCRDFDKIPYPYNRYSGRQCLENIDHQGNLPGKGKVGRWEQWDHEGDQIESVSYYEYPDQLYRMESYHGNGEISVITHFDDDIQRTSAFNEEGLKLYKSSRKFDGRAWIAHGVSYTYDHKGRLSREDRYHMGRRIGYHFTYSYKGDGSVEWVAYPANYPEGEYVAYRFLGNHMVVLIAENKDTLWHLGLGYYGNELELLTWGEFDEEGNQVSQWVKEGRGFIGCERDESGFTVQDTCRQYSASSIPWGNRYLQLPPLVADKLASMGVDFGEADDWL